MPISPSAVWRPKAHEALRLLGIEERAYRSVDFLSVYVVRTREFLRAHDPAILRSHPERGPKILEELQTWAACRGDVEQDFIASISDLDILAETNRLLTKISDFENKLFRAMKPLEALSLSHGAGGVSSGQGSYEDVKASKAENGGSSSAFSSEEARPKVGRRRKAQASRARAVPQASAVHEPVIPVVEVVQEMPSLAQPKATAVHQPLASTPKSTPKEPQDKPARAHKHKKRGRGHCSNIRVKCV